MRVSLPTETETAALATHLAAKAGAGQAFALTGDLGAGKTTFARYFIRALAGDEALVVPSPTYTLLETYDLPDGKCVWHYDAYRLERPDDILNTGYEEALETGAILLVEWPEKIGRHLPRAAIFVHFAFDADGVRSAEVTP